MIECCKESNVINKLKSYIGFAKKSGNLKIGSDNILAYKKFSVIIVSSNISNNTKNKLLNHSTKTNSEITLVSCDFMKYALDSEIIKAISITDKNLGYACLECVKNLEETTIE